MSPAPTPPPLAGGSDLAVPKLPVSTTSTGQVTGPVRRPLGENPVFGYPEQLKPLGSSSKLTTIPYHPGWTSTFGSSRVIRILGEAI